MNGERHHSPQPLDDELLLSLQRHECPRCGKNCRKPLIRVVCPVCSNVVTVNALDREGSTDSLCSKCDQPTTITITTDDAGCITAIEGWQNPVEEKPKSLDWKKTTGLALLGLIALLLIVNMLRPAVTPRVTGQATASPMPAFRNDEAELASPSAPEVAPVTDTLSGPHANPAKALTAQPTRAPVTPDMFAPE